MKMFVRVVELKSITAAAKYFRLSPAAASHRILQLEEQVGVRLLTRTTRSLHPTEAGTIFYQHALDVLAAVERAETSMAMASGVPAGELRVAAPLGFGRTILAPLVCEFSNLQPRVEIRLRLSDRSADLLTEPVDMAICMSDLPNSSLISRKLADCPRVLCASPAYLEKHGAPKQIKDLAGHNCLVLRFSESAEARWTLMTPDGPQAVTVSGRFDTDDGDVLIEWALDGEGILLKPYWEVAEYLRDGRLQIVLPDCPPEPVSLVMLYPHRQLPARVRAFADFLAEKTYALIPGPDDALDRVAA